MIQLHASLFSLLLSVMDDLLNHSDIHILSDTIRYDYNPGSIAECQKTISMPTNSILPIDDVDTGSRDLCWTIAAKGCSATKRLSICGT